jgi:hypothetical protein
MTRNENPLTAKLKHYRGDDHDRSIRARSKAMLAPNSFHVLVHHFVHELIKRHRMPPSKLVAGLSGIAQEPLDFGRPEIARVDLDQHTAADGLDALLRLALSTPFNIPADPCKRLLDKFAN